MDASLRFLRQAAVDCDSSNRRPEILRHVTDLFIVSADRLSEKEIALFDDVLNRLIADIELAAKALLAMRLAPIANAPPNTVRTLAFDHAIEVAGPILTHSERLDEGSLIAAAKRMSQAHLLAISQRSTLGEALTEVLVQRGDEQVLMRTAQNGGAKLSDTAFMQLAKISERDETLAVNVGTRGDIPAHVFRYLLQHASDRVRAKLEANLPDHVGLVRQVVSEVKARIESEELREEASATIRDGELNAETADAQLLKVAQRASFSELVMTLARIAQMPVVFVENALKQRQSDTVLLLAKANGISWATVKQILGFRARLGIMPRREIEESLARYERILPDAANRILDFYRTR